MKLGILNKQSMTTIDHGRVVTIHSERIITKFLGGIQK